MTKSKWRARSAMLAAVAGVAAAALIATPSYASPRESTIEPAALEDILWDERPNMFPQWYTKANAKVDHLGVKPVIGYPYYFFGYEGERDDPTYLLEYVLMCIDIFHDDYKVPPDSSFIDLTEMIPEETAREVLYTINAGLQLASDRGLEIRTDGSLPLNFTERDAASIMMAAQVKSWHLYARDYKERPIPGLQLSDFEVIGKDKDKNEIVVDLTPEYDELEELVARYLAEPTQTELAFPKEALTLSDESTTDFVLELDAEASTPGFEDFVEVTVNSDGSVSFVPTETPSEPVTLSFTKLFNHPLGGNHPTAGIRAEGQQAKAVVGAYFTESVSITLVPECEPTPPPPPPTTPPAPPTTPPAPPTTPPAPPTTPPAPPTTPPAPPTTPPAPPTTPPAPPTTPPAPPATTPPEPEPEETPETEPVADNLASTGANVAGGIVLGAGVFGGGIVILALGRMRASRRNPQ